jgi:ABC-type amino acid transport substrate-binding protein
MGQSGRISPAPRVITFGKHSEGFLALQQGKTDAHFTADIFLEGLRAKSPNPAKFEVRGFPKELGYRVTGLLLPEDDSDWRDMVNHALCYFVMYGDYYKLYDEWFGLNNPKAGFTRPLRDPIKTVLYWQCWGGIKKWLK